MTNSPGEVMRLGELADYLRVSRSTLYKLVQRGSFPGRKVGKQWRFHKRAVDDWLRQHPEHVRSKGKDQ